MHGMMQNQDGSGDAKVSGKRKRKLSKGCFRFVLGIQRRNPWMQVGFEISVTY
jgi:hypothetical protein